MFNFKNLARLLGSLTAVAALALSPVAQADSGPFIGASIGNATVSASIPDPVDPLFNPDINFDEDDFAWKVYGGFAFDLPVIDLGVELAYFDLGGPSTDAIPWKSSRIPKAFVSLSRPRRSTSTTEVRPTYAPEVTPNRAQ